MFEGIQFSSFGEFIAMGGYAFNVWAVYLLFALFLVVNLLGPLRIRKRLIKDLRRRTMLSEDRQSATPVNDD
jgi:heme exporter protein CcmD